MGKKQVYRFLGYCQGIKKRAEMLCLPSHHLCPGNCHLSGAQVAPQRCPILRLSKRILSNLGSFANGRFFKVKMVGFSM